MSVGLINTETGELIDFDQNAGPAVLYEELINHLAVPESANVFYSERFKEEFLDDEDEDEELAVSVLKWVFDHVHTYGRAPDPSEVQYRFPKIDFRPPVTDPKWLIDQFKNRWVRNHANIVIEKAARNTGKANPRPAIEEAVRELQKLNEAIRPQNTMLSNKDSEWVLDAHFQRIADMDGPSGVPFGFKPIDKHLLGLKKGMLVFTIARPKRYKSWMLIKSAVEAQKAGYRGVFFTLEMPLQEMYLRYACMVTGVGFQDMINGNLMDKDVMFVYEKLESIKNDLEPIVFLKPPVGSRHVSDLAIIAKEHRADVIYIDQLKFIECDLKVAADKRFATIERVCEELKEASEDFPIYVACQFNREAANMTEMADLSKIGLSDAIGQTGDILLGLYQSKEMKQSNELQFGVIDARQFEPLTWTIQVELSTNSNFRCTGLVD